MSSLMDQLIVRVGKACNFKCNFCNISYNERNVKIRESIEDIVRNFHYKFKYSDLSEKKILVTISGGEPSIFQREVIFILKYIKSFCDKKGVKVFFDMQTNGSNIDLDFARTIKELGMLEVMVSFHTIDLKIFEKILGVKYNPNFQKILSGIKNLKKTGMRVSYNIVLSNQNKNSFFDTIKFLITKFGKTKEPINLGLIQPHGEALKNLDKVIPNYNKVEKIYNKTIFYLEKIKQPYISHFVGLPICYLGKIKYSTEAERNKIFRKEYSFKNKSLINKINDNNKIQIKECKQCLYNNICSGIWKEYIGLQQLKPKIYKKVFSNNLVNKKNTFYFILNSKEFRLKKIYDSNIRQLIIKTTLGTKKEIYNLLRQANKIGFYKISLLINSEFILTSDVFSTGISNIQINIEKISLELINKLISFSNKNKPQFGINLDLFVKKYNIKNLRKIKNIIKTFPNNYVQIYFIYNYKNKEIYKYKKLIIMLEKVFDNIYTINFKV